MFPPPAVMIVLAASALGLNSMSLSLPPVAIVSVGIVDVVGPAKEPNASTVEATPSNLFVAERYPALMVIAVPAINCAAASVAAAPAIVTLFSALIAIEAALRMTPGLSRTLANGVWAARGAVSR